MDTLFDDETSAYLTQAALEFGIERETVDAALLGTIGKIVAGKERLTQSVRTRSGAWLYFENGVRIFAAGASRPLPPDGMRIADIAPYPGVVEVTFKRRRRTVRIYCDALRTVPLPPG